MEFRIQALAEVYCDSCYGGPELVPTTITLDGELELHKIPNNIIIARTHSTHDTPEGWSYRPGEGNLCPRCLEARDLG